MEEAVPKQTESNPQPEHTADFSQGKNGDSAAGRCYRVNLTVDVTSDRTIQVKVKAPEIMPSDQAGGEIPSASIPVIQSTAGHASVIVPLAPGSVEIHAEAAPLGVLLPLAVPTQAVKPEPAIVRQTLLIPRPALRSRLEKVKEWRVWPRTATWFQSLPVRRAFTTANVLFGLAIFVYLLTHLIGLAKFPIYYSADEAAATVYGADLVSNGLHDNYGELLPTFFKHDERYSLGILVYMQAAVFLVAGKSIFASRLVIVLASLVAAVWVSLILRDIFKLRHWWLGVMLLAATPAWFLFTRGVYDAVLMASMYAGFLYYYLLYRTRSPRYLYIALLLGALTFYAYPAGQIVIVVTGVMLFFSDIRYHWQQRKTALRGLGELVLLALPLVRFFIAHPGEYALRAEQYSTYWVQNISLLAKIGTFLQRALADLNPYYWFFPNSFDRLENVMKGYGHLLWVMLPFVLIGLWVTIRKIRASENRLLILALLAAPTAPAVVTLIVYRAIEIVIPFILLTAIGFSASLDWLAKRRPQWSPRVAYVTLSLLILFSFFMLRDSLVNGPTWFKDYSISGMEYGSSQVFAAARLYAQQHPDKQIDISPNWTYSPDILRRFFVQDVAQIHMETADIFMQSVRPGLENITFVFIPSDYQKVIASGWFKDPQVDLTVPYPDGTTGFYFVRLQYKDNIDQVIADQKAQLNRLVEGDITLNGEKVHVRYSPLDSGPIDNAFDGNLDTLVKTGGANPLVIELEFPTPRQLSSLTARVGSEPVTVTVTLTGDGDVPLGTFSQQAGASGFKDVTVDFAGVKAVTKLHFELLDTLAPDPSPVHLWELTLR
jgi:hypothetical protein